MRRKVPRPSIVTAVEATSEDWAILNPRVARMYVGGFHRKGSLWVAIDASGETCTGWFYTLEELLSAIRFSRYV